MDWGTCSRCSRAARHAGGRLLYVLRHRCGAESGQALVEFALILPLLLLILMGMLDFGRAVNYYNDMTQLAAEGARSAAVSQNADGTTASGTSIQTQIKAQADSPEIKKPSAGFQVCLGMPTSSGGYDITKVPTVVGQPVKARASMNFQLIPLVGSRIGFGTITLSATSTSRSELMPTYSAGCV